MYGFFFFWISKFTAPCYLTVMFLSSPFGWRRRSNRVYDPLKSPRHLSILSSSSRRHLRASLNCTIPAIQPNRYHAPSNPAPFLYAMAFIHAAVVRAGSPSSTFCEPVCCGFPSSSTVATPRTRMPARLVVRCCDDDV